MVAMVVELGDDTRAVWWSYTNRWQISSAGPCCMAGMSVRYVHYCKNAEINIRARE